MFQCPTSVKVLPLFVLLTTAFAAPPDHADHKHASPAKLQGSPAPRHAPMQHPSGHMDRGPVAPPPQAPAGMPGRGSYFTPEHHNSARGYFEMPEHRGFVPPGLAKKGGLPPGQAKKWQIGQPLPQGVVFYELPRPLAIHLGPPPAGTRYVRVATDILLIAIGTGLVLDALEDMAR